MKRLPRGLRVLLLVVLAVVLLALVVPYLLDLDRYRGLIAFAIEKETGRKVTLGQLRARLLPSVGFVIEEFALGNPPGFPEGPLLTAESIRGTLAWGPLLRREFLVSGVEIVRPRLVLLQDDRGKVNYELETSSRPGPREKPAEAGFRIADIDSIQLTGAELSLARVHFARGWRIVPYLHVRQVNAALEDIALDAKRLKQWRAEANLNGVRLELAGLKHPLEFRSGEFDLRGGAIESKFEFVLSDAVRAKGSLRVPNVEKAVATFDLSAPLLDLDKLREVTAKAEKESGPPARVAESELVAQGRLAAERVRWAGYEFTDTRTEIRIFTDRLEIWPAKAELYAGSLQVSARVDRRASPERFSANIQLRNLDMSKILATSPRTRGKMTGTGEMDLQLFGALGDKALDSLTGKGNFTIREGRFPGFSLGSLAKLQRALSLGAEGGGSELAYRSITGDLSIADGRVASERIHLDSPSGTIDLRGSFGFDQTLGYDGQAVLVRSATGGAQSPTDVLLDVLGGATGQNVGRLTVPFAIRGTFSEPKVQRGRGLPSLTTTAPAQTTDPQQQQQPEQKKKSILDLFRRP